jgi:hypothetical protein
MKDPTIPRKSGSPFRHQRTDPTIGWLVQYGEEVVLTDVRGNKWHQDRFRLLSGFGGSFDGLQRPPRPYVYSEGGDKVITEGDQGLIVFIHGAPQNPLFIPGARSTAPFDPDSLPSRSHQGDPNAMLQRHARVVLGDDENPSKPDAYFDIEYDPEDNAAELRIQGLASGKPVGAPLRIRLDKDTAQVQIDQGGTPKALVNEDVLVDLASSLTELAAAIKGLTSPFSTPETDEIIVKLGLGVDYVTTRLTSE